LKWDGFVDTTLPECIQTTQIGLCSGKLTVGNVRLVVLTQTVILHFCSLVFCSWQNIAVGPTIRAGTRGVRWSFHDKQP
jgi:hypothetical protein